MLLDDWEGYIKQTLREYGFELPFFLIGPSFGGSLVTLLSYRLQMGLEIPGPGTDWRQNYRGSVVLAPSVVLPKGVGNLLILATQAVAHVVPTLPIQSIDTKKRGGKMVNDIKLGKWQGIDPYTYNGKVRARAGVSCLKAQREIQGQMENFDFPILAMHGREDVTCPLEGTRQLISKSKSVDKQLVVLKGMKHDLLRDEGCENVINLILRWVGARTEALVEGGGGGMEGIDPCIPTEPTSAVGPSDETE